MAKIHTIHAAVHKGAQVKNGYRVKVDVLDLGLYINGMVVYPPGEKNAEWSVYTPAKKTGPVSYVHFIEFDKKKELWQEISEACIDAAKLDHSFSKDVILEDIDDDPINLDDIPF